MQTRQRKQSGLLPEDMRIKILEEFNQKPLETLVYYFANLAQSKLVSLVEISDVDAVGFELKYLESGSREEKEIRIQFAKRCTTHQDIYREYEAVFREAK